VAVLLAGGCSKKEAAAKAMAAPKTPQDEANVLGRDVFATIDAVLSYRSAHEGHMPVSLRQVGVDSLSRLTIRRLTVRGNVAEVTAVFRSTEGRELTACRGSGDIQEEASLNSGVFTVSCTSQSGGVTDYKVPGGR
jgi:hypothetical protein